MAIAHIKPIEHHERGTEQLARLRWCRDIRPNIEVVEALSVERGRAKNTNRTGRDGVPWIRR